MFYFFKHNLHVIEYPFIAFFRELFLSGFLEKVFVMTFFIVPISFFFVPAEVKALQGEKRTRS